ncbi:MAG: hypothetical protein WD052_00490 [Bacteroidales bacterium]
MRSRIQLISAEDQDCIISALIHDVFGGEILKTKGKNGWHFYNRLDGKRLDFSKSDFGSSSNESQFDDIPVSSNETSTHFETEQYSVFLMKFIRSFEENVGLKNNPYSATRSKAGVFTHLHP